MIIFNTQQNVMNSTFSPIQTQQEYHDKKEAEFIQSHGEVPPPTPMLVRSLPALNANFRTEQCNINDPGYVSIEPKKKENE